jgi:hypothetical protein
MSQEQAPIKVKVIEQPIVGEVWWIAALVVDALPQGYSSMEGGGMWEAFEDSDPHSNPWSNESDHTLWHVNVMGDASATTIRVTAPADQEQAWIDRLQRIDDIAAIARERRQAAQKLTAEDVIVRYYLMKRIGKKTTIKQLAQEYGFNENYLYQVKSNYDKSDKSADLRQGYVKQAYKVSEEP